MGLISKLLGVDGIDVNAGADVRVQLVRGGCEAILTRLAGPWFAARVGYNQGARRCCGGAA